MPLLRNDSIIDTAACNGTVSTHLSVGLSRPSIDRCSSVRRVCCCEPDGQEISIDCCTAGAQQQLRAVSRCQHSARCCSSMSVNWNVLVSVVVVFVVAVVVVGLLVSRYVRRRVRKLQLTADLQGVAVDNDEQDEVSSSSSCSSCCRRYRRCLSSGVTRHRVRKP